MQNNFRKTAPPVTHFCDVKLKAEELVTLPNGVNLHVVNMGELPVNRLAVLRAGGLYDTELPDAAAVMAASLSASTSKFTANEISDRLDFTGARLGCSIAGHSSGIEMLAVNSKLSELLPLVTDMLENASFEQKEVDATVQRMAAQRALQMQRVAYQASTKLHQLLQGDDHPASRSETPEGLLNVTRPEILSTYSDSRSCSTDVFIGGCLSEDLIEAVKREFSLLPASDKNPVKILPFKPRKPEKVKIEMAHSQQSAVSMGLPGISRTHEDYIALRLAVMALGGYFGSRLMKNIREEKGLTYGINSVLLGTREGSMLEIQAQCDARYVDRVIDETRLEIKRLADDPPHGDELERLRLHAWSQLAAATDSAFGVLDYYITRLKVGTPSDYFKKQLDAIGALSPDKIAEVTSRYIDPSSLTIVVAGK